MNTVPRIATGLELVDDEGDEVRVHRINESKDTVTLKTAQDESYTMGLRELRGKLRDGDFACLQSEPEEEEADEDQEEADADDDDDE